MRLIVCDHSINGPGGHYLAYAQSILDAARSSGIEGVLVTGTGFQPDGEHGGSTIPAYRYDFFGHPAAAIRAAPAESQRTPSLAARGLASLAIWLWFLGPVSLAYSVRRARFLFRLIGVAQLYRLLTGRSLYGIVQSSTNLARRASVAALRRVRQERRRRGNQAEAFAQDTAQWLARIRPAQDDIVFFPTISFSDCEGLALALDRHPEYRRATWCLLFRRNLYGGDRTTYDRSLTRAYRALFERLAGFARLFTDSEELSRQYAHAFGMPFAALPIPHTKHSLMRGDHGAVLVGSYVGDARTEKGFPLLPRLVADCAADPALAARVAFRVQANYNLPGGEPRCVVAKSQLSHARGAKVELLDRALSASEYDDLLRQSDFGLLLYARDNYYARTSGVLIEYLSAGIPVLAPSKTWLAAQLAQPHARYRSELHSRLELLASAQAGGSGDTAGIELPQDSGRARFLVIDVECAAASYFSAELSVEFEGWDLERSTLRPIVDSREIEGRSSRMLRVPAGTRCLRLRVARATRPDLTIAARAYASKQEGEVPLGAVGIVYDTDDEILEGVRELARHYAHYKSTALEFARETADYHNAPRLVAELRAASGRRAASVG